MFTMKMTLYDLMDGWTLVWDDTEVEMRLLQLGDEFSKHKVIFHVLEKLFDVYEATQDPLEFMTDERKMMLVVGLLRDNAIERAAKAVELDVPRSLDESLQVLNADTLMRDFPSLFEDSERPSRDEMFRSLFD